MVDSRDINYKPSGLMFTIIKLWPEIGLLQNPSRSQNIFFSDFVIDIDYFDRTYWDDT